MVDFRNGFKKKRIKGKRATSPEWKKTGKNHQDQRRIVDFEKKKRDKQKTATIERQKKKRYRNDYTPSRDLREGMKPKLLTRKYEKKGKSNQKRDEIHAAECFGTNSTE